MNLDELEDEFAARALREAVENQVLDGHPREVGLTLTNLVEQGVERERALDAIAWVLAKHISETLDRDLPFDVNAYARNVLALEHGLPDESDDEDDLADRAP